MMPIDSPSGVRALGRYGFGLGGIWSGWHLPSIARTVVTNLERRPYSTASVEFRSAAAPGAVSCAAAAAGDASPPAGTEAARPASAMLFFRNRRLLGGFHIMRLLEIQVEPRLDQPAPLNAVHAPVRRTELRDPAENGRGIG